MVFYQGINYLQHALAAKRSLLEQCLIPVPQHFFGLEDFSSSEEDQKPWKRVTVAADDVLLIEAATFVQEEAKNLKVCSAPLNQLESFDSCSSNGGDTSFGQVLFDLDCDLVPSSNPSSAEDFTPNDFFTDDRKEPIEYFIKEDLKQFSTKHEHLKIEMLSSTRNNLQSTLKNYPNFNKVQSRLTPETIKDPFEFDKTAEQTENKIFSRICIHRLHAPFDEDNSVAQCENKHAESISWPLETFCKFDSTGNTGVEQLEEFCCLSSEDIVLIDTFAILKRDVFAFENGKVEDGKSMLINIIGNFDGMPETKIELLNKSGSDGAQTVLSFQAINDLDTETDRFCDAAILEIPKDLDEKINVPPIVLPDRTAVCLPHSLHVCVIDERKRTMIEKSLFLSDRFRADEHAARLAEPQLPGLEPDMHDEVWIVKQLRRMIDSDRHTVAEEAMLCWRVDRNMHQGDVTVSQCEQLEGRSNQEDQNLRIDTVECVQKYSSVDMYGWEDPFLNVDNQSSKENQPVASKEDRLVATKLTMKEVSSSKKVKSAAVGIDPVEAFMALRARQTATVANNKTEERAQLNGNKDNDLTTTISTVSASEQKLQTITEESQPLYNVPQQNNSTHIVSEAQKKTKHHVITVNLSEDFLQILDQLTKAAASHLVVLRQHRQISADDSIMSIKPDASRFLIKQREQFIKDNQLNAESDEEYRSLIVVHGIVTAMDITSKCCLESTIGFLSALQDKYSSVLKNCLDPVRQRLFELKAWFSQRKIYHPKVAAMCKEIEIWLKKKRVKSKDTEQKILVLVKHDMPSLLSCLKSALAEGRLLTPDVLRIVQPDMVIKSLDNHNCLIAHKSLVDERFPWCQFSLVVEYDYEPGSSWQELCHRQSIRHIGVQLEPCNVPEYVDEKRTVRTLIRRRGSGSTLVTKPYIDVNSKRRVKTLAQDFQYYSLYIIMSRENILLLERDYSTLETTRNIFFSDLDIDENSGIILASLHSLSDDRTLLELITRVTALSLKYSHCWIVLCPDKNTSSYPMTNLVVNNVCKLEGAVNNFKRKSKSFTAKVIMCFDASRLASIIRGISEKVLMGNTGDQELDSSFDRSWLMPEMSQEEKLLLSIPCFSSFSAQLLLKKVGLKSLFSASKEELVSWLPEMSSTVIQTFVRYINSSTGLQLLTVSTLRDSNREENKVSQNNLREDTRGNKSNRSINKTREITNNEVTGMGANSNIGGDKTRNLYVSEDFQIFVTDNEFNEINTVQGLATDGRRYAQTNIKLNQIAEPVFESGGGDVRQSNVENTYVNRYQSNVNTSEAKEQVDVLGECYGNTSEKQQFAGEVITNLSVGFRNRGQYISPLDFIERKKSDDFSNHFHSDDVPNSDVAGFTSFPRTSEQLGINKKGRNVDMNGNHLSECESRAFQEQSTTLRDKDDYGLSVSNKQQTGYQQPVSNKQQTGYQQPVSTKQQTGYQQPVATKQQTGYQQPVSTKQQTGYQQPVSTKQQPGYQQPVSTKQQTGYQQPVSTKQQTGYQQPVSTKQQTDYQQRVSNNDGLYRQHSPTLFQNEFGRVTETFDYNHGLPLQEQVASDINDINMDSVARYDIDIDPRYRHRISEREKEFPSSEEVHNSFISSSNFDMEMDKAESNSNFQINISMPEDQAVNTKQGNTNDDDPFNFNLVYKPETETSNQAERHSGGVSSLKIRKGSESLAGEAETQERSLNNCKLYVNPNLERITRRPDCITKSTPTKPSHTPTKSSHTPGNNWSLEKDLRETTRKLLLNTQQFASLGKSSLRNSSHKINIGLAQPLQRQVNTSAAIPTEDQALMQQSLWTNNDSPPMDLGYDNSQLDKSEGQPTSIGTSNKVVITSHTPQKKRRLTYQPIPGKKGQTKLVFK